MILSHGNDSCITGHLWEIPQSPHKGPVIEFELLVILDARRLMWHHQCRKVCLSEADNFGGGPGTFCWFFFNFYVYDFRFKVWGPKTFLAEFQTLDITVMISLDDTVLYHRLGCVMIQSEITGYCIHHNNEKCNINPTFNYHLIHWGRDKMAAIFQTFLMHFLMKIYQICLKWVKTPMFYLGKKLLGPNRTRLHLIPWKIIH